MHPYATDSAERKWVIVYLAVVSIVLGELTGWVTQRLPNWSQWFWDFSAVAWFTLLYFLVDEYLWKHPRLRLPGLFQLPNLNGTWTGVLNSSYYDFKLPQPCTMKIRQTWTQLSVTFHLDERTSHSYSIAASILLNFQGRVTLRYEYINHPEEEFRGILDMHGGTNQLFFIREEEAQQLNGPYYTDREEQTRGVIVVSKPVVKTVSWGSRFSGKLKSLRTNE
jgi:hypothetical protein